MREVEDGASDRDEDDREEDHEDDDDGLHKKRGPRKKKNGKEHYDRAKLRRHEANARERSRMHGLNLNARNFLTDHNGDVMFSGRAPYDAMYPYPGSDLSTPPVHGGGSLDSGAKPFRPYGYSGASYDPYYEGQSPESPHFEGQLSPNFNGIFSLKHDDPPDYGKGSHYGVRYCGAPGRTALTHGSMYRVSPEARFPYDLHVRSQSYQTQGEVNGSFHN
uniref:Neurogenic differentiation factor domain-containing protein n=1 Tax=Gouania willdenowi TaxID=441366 RepID=A0A8C5I8W5_GOUWI